MVTFPYAYMAYIVSPLAGLGGTYRGGRPPTTCFGLKCVKWSQLIPMHPSCQKLVAVDSKTSFDCKTV